MPAYWEIIADKLKAAGWSLGWNQIGNAEGVMLWHVDASRGDGRRFIGQAEEITTAFLELDRMVAGAAG